EKSHKREIITKEIPPPRPIGGAEKMVPPAFEVQERSFPIAPPAIFKAPAETHAGVTPTIAKAEDRRTDIATLLASASGFRDPLDDCRRSGQFRDGFRSRIQRAVGTVPNLLAPAVFLLTQTRIWP